MIWRRSALAAAMVLAVSTGCGSAGPAGPSITAASPAVTATPSVSRSSVTPRATPTPQATRETREPSAASSAKPKPAAKPPGLKGDRRNALAFAPLDDPSEVTIEGRVDRSPAWSTSKVLVVAAFLKTRANGDPSRVSRANRSLIKAALTRSDADAVLAIRRQIRGRPGPAMTSVLRKIGDKTTVAPDNSQGLMAWSVREQVRFMAALANGKVVSKAASAYLISTMHPINAHAWGLGTIGAKTYKGGWLRRNTVTRQMGIVDGYAVAIITDGVGPAVRQTDGDSAHVQQMNKLAKLLQRRLAYERSRR